MGRRKSPVAIKEHFRIRAGKKKANCNGFMESGSERLKVVNTEASWYKRRKKMQWWLTDYFRRERLEYS